MRQMEANISRMLFPLALEEVVKNIAILKDGLACEKTAYLKCRKAEDLFGEVFAKARKGKGRLYYMWEGDATNSTLPQEISMLVEDQEETLMGTYVCRIVAKDPFMMQLVLMRLFSTFPPRYVRKLSRKHRVIVEDELVVNKRVVYTPYLG